MAGEYPGDWSERSARKKLRALIASGVRTFVDLTEEGELDSYDEWLEKEAKAAGVEVAYHRHSIRDLDVPTSDGMRAILDLIESAIDAERAGLRALLGRHRPHGHGRVLLARRARVERGTGAGRDRAAEGGDQEAADHVARDAGAAGVRQRLESDD